MYRVAFSLSFVGIDQSKRRMLPVFRNCNIRTLKLIIDNKCAILLVSNCTHKYSRSKVKSTKQQQKFRIEYYCMYPTLRPKTKAQEKR